MAAAKRTDPTARPAFWRCGECGTPNPEASYLTHCIGCGGERRTTASRVETRVEARSTRGRDLRAAAWAYAALVFTLLVLIRWVGKSWWGVAVLVFLPRWIFLAPVLVLAVASGFRRCPWHWAVQGATALVVAGPLMGLCLPVSQLWTKPPEGGQRVRVVTFNMGEEPLPTAALRDWLARESVDVVCLQEGRRLAGETRALLGVGWHVSREGSIASRWPIVWEMPAYPETVASGERWTGKLELVRLRTPSGVELAAASAHLPTLRYGMSRFFTADVAGGRRHLDWWGNEISRMLSAVARSNDLPLILAGDFNMPADDSTMAGLRAHFRFAFEEAGWGYGYTRPARLPWIRIDHVLAGPEWTVTRCRVGPNLGSDHLPVLAELVSTPAPSRASP